MNMDDNEELLDDLEDEFSDESFEEPSGKSDKESAGESVKEEAQAEPAVIVMVDVVGVKFKRAGKIYSFDPSGIDFKMDDWVVVETARGMEVGQIAKTVFKVADSMVTKPLKPVVRKATPEDIDNAGKLEAKEAEALVECAGIVKKMELPMKLISAEYNLEGSHLTIFFGAEGRIDFRELVRELSHKLKARIEMRQVGPRDEAKLIGGYGRCGRPLCCATFLNEFNPVSIKMAKEQNLPLNPMKISGTCGRLLCCLGYEFEQYRDMKKEMLKNGENIQTSMGAAVVVGGNPLKGTVLLEVESGARIELPVSEVAPEKKEADKGQQQKKRKHAKGK